MVKISSGDNLMEEYDAAVHRFAGQITANLSNAVLELLSRLPSSGDESIRLECHLSARSQRNAAQHIEIASTEFDTDDLLRSTLSHRFSSHFRRALPSPASSEPSVQRWHGDGCQASKRRRVDSMTSQNSPTMTVQGVLQPHHALSTKCFNSAAQPQAKRIPDNPALQPSSLGKLIAGIWENLYSDVKLDPAQTMEQWQAIEAGVQQKSITDTDVETALQSSNATVQQNTFNRMSILTRNITQASRACRSLEVIIQAHWIQCFDEHVTELSAELPPGKAKKVAFAGACHSFRWSEKELRNRMGIWRAYHDIVKAAGWVTLVFAGQGLYRFCKYRAAFDEQTFTTLRKLQHRFEVAADTLHPHWRQILSIIGLPTDLRYPGHPHDWVVELQAPSASPSENPSAVPLPETYRQWDQNFSYTHVTDSILNTSIWGSTDPREALVPSDPDYNRCLYCREIQSDDPAENHCLCFPTLYGGHHTASNPSTPPNIPVQIFRTANGSRNNGLLACRPFERGTGIGEFVGEITADLSNLDVMVGENKQPPEPNDGRETRRRETYQIWQGRKGNHTRFVNHSCEPNSQYEIFRWRGKERIVLVSLGIEAGEEITVDYSDAYWKDLEKVCLCGSAKCRYKDREGRLFTSASSSAGGSDVVS